MCIGNEMVTGGIPRAKLSNEMVTYLPLAQREVVTLVVRMVENSIAANHSKEGIWWRMAVFLSHNAVRAARIAHSIRELTEAQAAAGVIESIGRKWDIENDRPFPEGVERVWSEPSKRSDVVWKKTGSPYYTSQSNSSD